MHYLKQKDVSTVLNYIDKLLDTNNILAILLKAVLF